jgi:alkylation response protein AidB-like acyl-CoA dehydrogenase
MRGWSGAAQQQYDRFRDLGERRRETMEKAWQECAFPWEMWRDLAAAGLFADLDGDLADRADLFAAAIDGVTHGSLDGGFAFSAIAQAMAVSVLNLHGDARLAERYGDGLRSGEELVAFAVTEPHGGTDPFNARTTATRSGDGSYRLSGQKWHITQAGQATVLLIWALEPESRNLVGLFIEPDAPGVEISADLPATGARSSPVATIALDEVVVPAWRAVAHGAGREVLSGLLVVERILGSFAAVGVLEAVLDDALGFALGRKSFERQLAAYQHIQRRLTDMKIRGDSLRALAHTTLEMRMGGERAVLEASELKLSAVRAAMDSAVDAIQVCGSYGLLEPARLHMVLLDAVSSSIGGGTEEAHRMIIFTEMVRRSRRGSRDTPAALELARQQGDQERSTLRSDS